VIKGPNSKGPRKLAFQAKVEGKMGKGLMRIESRGKGMAGEKETMGGKKTMGEREARKGKSEKDRTGKGGKGGKGGKDGKDERCGKPIKRGGIVEAVVCILWHRSLHIRCSDDPFAFSLATTSTHPPRERVARS
jgi:hypothetical protein